MLNFKMLSSTVFLLFFVSFQSLPAFAAPTHIIDSGQLVGVDGLNVNGILYDVRFRDTSAQELFYDSATNSYIFDFNTREESHAASVALFDSIKIYENYPEDIFGTEDETYAYIETPYLLYSMFPYSYVYASYVKLSNDFEDAGNASEVAYAEPAHNTTSDLSTWEERVYAKWTPSNAVPIPGSSILLGLGLVCLLGANRKLTEG